LLPSFYSNKIFIKSSLIEKEINKLLKKNNPIAFFDCNATEFKGIEVKKYVIEDFFSYEAIREDTNETELFIDFNKMYFEHGVDTEIVKEFLLKKYPSLKFEFNSIYNNIKKDVIVVKNTKGLLQDIKKTKTEKFYLVGFLFPNSAASASIKNTLSTNIMNTTRVSSSYEKDSNVLSNTFNILYVLRGMNFFVNDRYTTTNNFYEIQNNYGIESCRTLIIRELKTRLLGIGKNVNTSHLKLIADIMTNYGFLTGFTHNSTSLKNFGAYYNSTFEQALQSFKKGALGGKIESTNPLSTSILIGKKLNCGSGKCNFVSFNLPEESGGASETDSEKSIESDSDSESDSGNTDFDKKLMDE